MPGKQTILVLGHVHHGGTFPCFLCPAYSWYYALNKGLFFILCTERFGDTITLEIHAPISEFVCVCVCVRLMIAFKGPFPLVSLFSFCWRSGSQILDHFSFFTNFLFYFLLPKTVLSFPWEIWFDFSSNHFTALQLFKISKVSFLLLWKILKYRLIATVSSPISLRIVLIYFLLPSLSPFPFSYLLVLSISFILTCWQPIYTYKRGTKKWLEALCALNLL